MGNSWGLNRASRVAMLCALLGASQAHAQSAEGSSEALPPPPPPPSNPPPTASPSPPPPAALPVSAAELPPSEPPRRVGLERQPLSRVGERLIYVRIHAGERPFSVVARDDAEPIAMCDRDCGFWAWPGTYSVRLRLAGAAKDSSLSLRLRKPGLYELIPANKAARNTGIVLGIAGPVVGFVGLLMTVVGVLEAGCSYDDASQSGCHNAGPEPIAYYGLATLAAGAGMTTVGWLMFAHNRAHFQLSDDPRALGASARVTVLPLPQGGLGLGAVVAF